MVLPLKLLQMAVVRYQRLPLFTNGNQLLYATDLNFTGGTTLSAFTVNFNVITHIQRIS